MKDDFQEGNFPKYKIKKGDNLSKIARQNNLNLEKLIEVNNIDPKKLQINQEIQLPFENLKELFNHHSFIKKFKEAFNYTARVSAMQKIIEEEQLL
jgi:LysM repeat protein